MKKYEIQTNLFGEEIIVRDNGDGTFTSFGAYAENSDYQRYLRWLNGEDEEGTIS